MNKKEVKDLGMSFEEAIVRDDFLQCYQYLGKFYTDETFDTAPPVLLGQCPWEEEETASIGTCTNCNFTG
jgi:hypothetical protein